MQRNTITSFTSWMLIAIMLAAAPAFAQEFSYDKEGVAKGFKKPGYSPYAGRNFPTQVYWGDTHLHTGLSGDAFGFGNKLNDEDAFRFAQGNEITSPGGERVKLSRPLDFLVVADHAEAYGAMIEVYKGHPSLMVNPTLKRWNQMLRAGGEESFRRGDGDDPECLQSIGAP